MPQTPMPGERIESLVDELFDIIDHAKAPFGGGQGRKVIDVEEVYNILDEIKMSYPEEWQRSRRILKERDELLAAASSQADSIVSDAQSQARIIAGDQEIVRLAQSQADQIRDRAQKYERDTRYAAEDYAEQVFAHLEENLKGLTATVGRCRQQLNQQADDAQGVADAQQGGQWS